MLQFVMMMIMLLLWLWGFFLLYILLFHTHSVTEFFRQKRPYDLHHGLKHGTCVVVMESLESSREIALL